MIFAEETVKRHHLRPTGDFDWMPNSLRPRTPNIAITTPSTTGGTNAIVLRPRSMIFEMTLIIGALAIMASKDQATALGIAALFGYAISASHI